MLGNYSNFRNYGLNFSTGQADTFSLTRPLNFLWTNASICDTSGELLFYSNGITIMNRNHDTLQNAFNFNPGYFTSYYANDGLGLFYSSIIIPKPGNENSKYYIFHESAQIVTYNSVQAAHPLNLRYSEIDITLDGGLGGIDPSHKNIIILSDTLAQGRVSAVKHGNGRDWWLLVHRFNSNLYYKFLVTHDSIQLFSSQNIGSINPHYNYYGQSLFSEDGDKYVIQVDDSTVDLYDFDRCSGLLSNEKSISIDDGNLAVYGCALSRSGRYLYINNNKYIHQFDTQAANIWNSHQLVATWDTFFSPGPTTFGTLKLAPDNRIYINTYVGTNMLHYIENPDTAGIMCGVIQNSFIVPSFNTFSFPNSPNWALGSSISSFCDSLINISEDNIDVANEIEIFPNPAQNNFSVKAYIQVLPETTFAVYDNLGKERFKISLNYSLQNFNSSELNDGMYFYLIETSERILKSGKLIIKR